MGRLQASRRGRRRSLSLERFLPFLHYALDVANPFDEEKQIYIEMSGFPEGWKASIDQTWVLLPPFGRKQLEVVVTPNPDAPRCKTATLNIWGEALLGDAWQPYSGVTSNITLANPITFQLWGKPIDEYEHSVSGCTAPAQPDTEIALILRKGGGEEQVVFATTDAYGCFTTVVTLPDTEPWSVRPYFRGDDCDAATEGKGITLNAPPDDDGGKQ